MCLPVIYELQTEKLLGEFPTSAEAAAAVPPLRLSFSFFFFAVVVLVYALNLVTS